MAIHAQQKCGRQDYFLLQNMILLFSELGNQMSPTTNGIEHLFTLQQKSFRVTILEKIQEESMTVVMLANQKSLLCPKRVSQTSFNEVLDHSKSHEETIHSRFRSWNIFESFLSWPWTEKRMELHGYVMTTITLITKYEFNLKPQFQIL
jgi:6-pyruvoyl-tetrahydropterin synthase